MKMSKALSGVSLLVALSAFGLAGVLSLRVQVEPLYAVLRSIGAFLGVLVVTRWFISVLDSLPTDHRPNRSPNHGDNNNPHMSGLNR